MNRVTAVAEKKGSVRFFTETYTLDAVGDKTLVVDTRYDTTAGTSVLWSSTGSYSYDSLDRLLTDTFNDSSTTYSYTRTYGYDLVGNRLKMTDTHGGSTDTVTYAYDNRDRLTTETHPAGDTISYVFDDAGNEISKTTSGGTTATESYTYDDLNRMTNDSVVGGDSTDYHYDDEGNQVYISDSGQVLWDTNNPSGYAQEIQENNSRTFFTGLAVLAQWINSSGGANYLLGDGHGSTRYVTDSSGGVQNEILYDSFGNTLTTQPGSIYATKVLFTGQWFRSASGMYDLRARMYDPNVGRFATQDNMVFGAGDLTNSNLYLFVGNNPGNLWDPSGHFLSSADTAAATTIGEDLDSGRNVVALAIQRQAAQRIALIGLSVAALGTAGLIYAGFRGGLGSAGQDDFGYNPEFAGEMAAGAEQAEKAEALKKEIETITDDAKGKILFHYTDVEAAYQIEDSQFIFATQRQANAHLPSGAYSTDIAPFDLSYTQQELSDTIYYNPARAARQDVSWCVILEDDNNEFQNVSAHQWCKLAPAESSVPVHVWAVVPNAMLKN